jgi:hypothetical protein
MLVLASALTAIQPLQMGPLPPGLRTPVLALELSRSAAEIERMFGPAGSAEREAWRAGMLQGTWLDFAFMLAYGLFLAGMASAIGPVGRRRPAQLAFGLACVAPLFDVLENTELLTALHGLGGSYDGAVALLVWFTWAKWLGLGGYFCALAPALWRSGGAFRGASVFGVAAAASATGALVVRGVLAEVMAAGLALAMLMMVIGSFRGMPRSTAP